MSSGECRPPRRGHRAHHNQHGSHDIDVVVTMDHPSDIRLPSAVHLVSMMVNAGTRFADELNLGLGRGNWHQHRQLLQRRGDWAGGAYSLKWLMLGPAEVRT
jgi:gamma-glutamyl phosphate reductase